MFVPLLTLAIVATSLVAISLPYLIIALLQMARRVKAEPGDLPPGWAIPEQRS